MFQLVTWQVSVLVGVGWLEVGVPAILIDDPT